MITRQMNKSGYYLLYLFMTGLFLGILLVNIRYREDTARAGPQIADISAYNRKSYHCGCKHTDDQYGRNSASNNIAEQIISVKFAVLQLLYHRSIQKTVFLHPMAYKNKYCK